MIERAEVEELLAVLEKVRKPNNGTLAKLCRVVPAHPASHAVGAYKPPHGDRAG